MQSVDFWRKLNTEFTGLAEEEWATVPDPSDNRRLRAYGSTNCSVDCVGTWNVSAGPNENSRARFEETATRVGYALNPPQGAKGLDFWLHRLFLDLLELDELRNDRSPLVVGQKDRGGIIRDVCNASATYCSRLSREPMDKEADTSPNPVFEFQQTEHEQRRAAVDPILLDTVPNEPSVENKTPGSTDSESRSKSIAASSASSSVPVRRNTRTQAIDNELRAIAESHPRNHEEVFGMLDGRVNIPYAEPFKTAGGWSAGFRRDRNRAQAWLSKSWARLGLPPFVRGPK